VLGNVVFGLEARGLPAAEAKARAQETDTRLRLQDEILRLWEVKRTTVVFVTHDLDEAIVLAQRVVLMAAGRGRVQRVVEIGLPYPRERTHDDFAEYRRELFEEFHLLHEQAVAAAA
jgi:NitT/TauT family transport system ATP-binding protein